MRIREKLIAPFLVAAVSVTACSSGTALLEDLKTDPMANIDYPGAIDVRRSESPGSTGPGVPSPATVRTTFTVPAGTLDDAIATLADEARQAGWTLEERAVVGFNGEKTINGRFSQIMITGNADQDIVWVDLWTRD